MKKILIVEDQMLARKYLCSCIEKSTECEVGICPDPGRCSIAEMW